MISLNDQMTNPDKLPADWQLSEVEQSIVRRMAASRKIYAFASLYALRFELRMRLCLTLSARSLAVSGAGFAVFKESKCNPDYWQLQENGAFRLKDGTAPADAVEDIYRQGYLYGFECATAIIIVMYHAALTCIGRPAFNRYFNKLELYSWQTDSDLGLATVRPVDYFPGDARYFENPDYELAMWQGENVVTLQDGLYYGHGLGIAGYSQIIETLNRLRKPDAKRSAALLEQATRPDFNHLGRLAEAGAAASSPFYGTAPDRTRPYPAAMDEIRRRQQRFGFAMTSLNCHILAARIGTRLSCHIVAG